MHGCVEEGPVTPGCRPEDQLKKPKGLNKALGQIPFDTASVLQPHYDTDGVRSPILTGTSKPETNKSNERERESVNSPPRLALNLPGPDVAKPLVERPRGADSTASRSSTQHGGTFPQLRNAQWSPSEREMSTWVATRSEGSTASGVIVSTPSEPVHTNGATQDRKEVESSHLDRRPQASVIQVVGGPKRGQEVTGTDGSGPEENGLDSWERGKVRWQGVEAIFEAYQLYLEETAMERRALETHKDTLAAQNVQLHSLAGQLSTRLADLLNYRQRLQSEREARWEAIEALRRPLQLPVALHTSLVPGHRDGRR